MPCLKCNAKPVIDLQHGALCKNHFLEYFEDKVFKTMRKYQFFQPEDRVCVAVSGGKDSLTVLYLTKKYLQEQPHQLFALCIDEGIAGYREKTIEDLKLFCAEQKIDLEIVRSEDVFGKPLDEAYPLINKDAQKKPCNVCGVWRRYLLNKIARERGATKVVTGHNLDDEAQAIMMNIFKANTTLAGRLGPITGVQEHDLFPQRVKPLYFCLEKEVRLYALLKNFQVTFTECPYSREGYRSQIQEMLNSFEQKYKGTKQGIVKSFLAILPLLKDQEVEEIGTCVRCGEPANREVCNACAMKEVIHGQGTL